MKILVVSPQETGVDYYRIRAPHKHLRENYEVDVTHTPSLDSDKDFYYQLKDYDAVVVNRLWSYSGKNIRHVKAQLEKADTKLILDVDDYWTLPTHHLLYEEYKHKNLVSNQIESLRLADAVTTTTPRLASEVKKHNKHVYVLPNAIDPEEKQWQINDIERDKMTFAFIGGVHHLKDMTSVAGEFKKINQFEEDYNLYYGGWVDHEYNNVIAMVMSDKGQNKRFNVIKALEYFNYGVMYDMTDVCISPLIKDTFSQCKSELKAIEAGFKKKALICSNVYPFKYVCDETNSLPFKKDLAKQFKKCLENPNLVEDLGEKLHEDVKVKYHMDTVTKKRKQVYEHILK